MQGNKPILYRPRLVLAYGDSRHAVSCCRQLRRRGWEVHLTGSGREARRLAAALAPAVVVLDTELHDESGWLTCAKLRLEQPGQHVVLVCGKVTPEAQRYAAFLGADTLLTRDENVDDALLDHVQGPALSTAG
jgi:DNA-binding response OmpR family regulator